MDIVFGKIEEIQQFLAAHSTVCHSPLQWYRSVHPGTNNSLHHGGTDFFFFLFKKDLWDLQHFSLRSPSQNSFSAQQSPLCKPASKNLHAARLSARRPNAARLVRGGVCSPESGEKNVIMQELERRCDEGAQREHRDCRFAEEQEKRVEPYRRFDVAVM